jgi:hypothetical protein
MPLPSAALISAASQVFSVGSSSLASSCIAALVHGPPGCGKNLSRLVATRSSHHILSGKSTLVANVAKQLGVALRRIDCFSFAYDIPVMHFSLYFFCILATLTLSHTYPRKFSRTQGESEMRVTPS